MSHFTVMVIGENPEKQLKPFDENLKVEFVDETENYKKQYNTESTKEFYCDSSSSWGMQITKELFDFIKKSKIGATRYYNVSKMGFCNYFKKGGKYRGYYEIKGKRCKGDAWFEVENVDETNHPTEDICFEGRITIRKIAAPKKISLKDKYPNYKTYLQNYHGETNMDKQGHWRNPNAKWDWYSLGGRWSGLIKLKDGKTGIVGEAGVFNNEIGIDQAKKCDIENFDELVTFALLKDGKWFERGKMGWWGIVSNENDEWDNELKKLLKELPDETLISIYDCHI